MNSTLMLGMIATLAIILAAMLKLYKTRVRLQRNRQMQERLIDWNQKRSI